MIIEIGVLALQGDFEEHVSALRRIGIRTREVRLPEHLKGIQGLIIPGGESTTIGKLATDFELIEPLKKFGARHAIWGTCAGAIFISRDASRQQPLLGLMDIHVERNAFGRQIDSFEIDLEMPFLRQVDPTENGGENIHHIPFHAIFIRAPIISSVYGRSKVLASLPDGRIVAAWQERLLATSFHPELTGDDRFHRYFVEMAK